MYATAAGSHRYRFVEHRYSARKTMRLPVEIFHHKRSIGFFKTRDISPQGAFIDAGQIYLFCNDFVHINFMIRDVFTTQEYKLKALVRHLSKHGIGVMFTDDLPEFFRVLQGLLRTTS